MQKSTSKRRSTLYGRVMLHNVFNYVCIGTALGVFNHTRPGRGGDFFFVLVVVSLAIVVSLCCMCWWVCACLCIQFYHALLQKDTKGFYGCNVRYISYASGCKCFLLSHLFVHRVDFFLLIKIKRNRFYSIDFSL